jgi:hypothetical protein
MWFSRGSYFHVLKYVATLFSIPCGPKGSDAIKFIVKGGKERIRTKLRNR